MEKYLVNAARDVGNVISFGLFLSPVYAAAAIPLVRLSSLLSMEGDWYLGFDSDEGAVIENSPAHQ
jgi:hypothetical protein